MLSETIGTGSPGHGGAGELEDAPAAGEADRPGDRRGVKPSDGGRCLNEKRAASLLPGGVTYVANLAQSGFKPAYEVPPNIQGAEEKIAKAEERINRAFFADLFLMISQLDTVRTATEIIERKQEKMLMLGPFLERSQFELINPMIDRVFAMMARAGYLPSGAA